jgi:chromate transporter
MRPVVALAVVFGQLSLLAFGGANAILPDLHRQVVDQGWMNGQEFAALFALAQAAPGPNMMVFSLIGWRVAGLTGALVATVAIILPAAILTYFTSGLWFRLRDRPWRKAIQAGLTPVTIGLVVASAALVTASTTVNWRTGLISAAVAGTMYFTKTHPLALLAGAAAIGAIGFA